jgi:hypothetical protein
MLDVALQFLTDELNTFLLTRTGSDTVKAKLTKLVDETGKYGFEQGIGINVINIEEERTVKEHLPEHAYVNGRHVVKPPELRLNLHVMFAANLKLYEDSLKYISYILTFFQAHPAFTPDGAPGLDARVEKLLLELQSPGYEQLNQIWAFIGGKQLPAVIYKVRMVVVQPDEPSGIQPPITRIGTIIQRK